MQIILEKLNSFCNFQLVYLKFAVKFDDFVKNLNMRFPVIPAKAGIQFFQDL